MTQKNPRHSQLVLHFIDRRLDTVNQIASIYLRLILPNGYLTFVSDPIDDPFINKNPIHSTHSIIFKEKPGIPAAVQLKENDETGTNNRQSISSGWIPPSQIRLQSNQMGQLWFRFDGKHVPNCNVIDPSCRPFCLSTPFFSTERITRPLVS